MDILKLYTDQGRHNTTQAGGADMPEAANAASGKTKNGAPANGTEDKVSLSTEGIRRSSEIRSMALRTLNMIIADPDSATAAISSFERGRVSSLLN